jgi:phosphatidylglycerol:prolipoprotein diacylglycerol transferase
MFPYILHSGHLLLPTFGILAAAGVMAALALSLRTSALVGLCPDKLWNAGFFVILTAFALSRILLIVTNLHSFFAYPILLLMVPSLTPTGILLTFVATFFYLRLRKIPWRPALDAWSPCATLVWAFLALGHFAEGSDAGLPTTRPWGLAIPPDTTRLHPVALYAALAAALLTIVLLRHLRSRTSPGETTAVALASTGLLQFFLSFFRQPYPYSGSFHTFLDPIQWIALGMIVLSGIFFFRPRKLVSHAV